MTISDLGSCFRRNDKLFSYQFNKSINIAESMMISIIFYFFEESDLLSLLIHLKQKKRESS